MTFTIDTRALLRPLCWLLGHRWRDYTVIHVAWTPEGRFCSRCGKQQFVKHTVEFVNGETVQVRTDWRGTERFVYVSRGEGSHRDPIRLERAERRPDGEHTWRDDCWCKTTPADSNPAGER